MIAASIECSFHIPIAECQVESPGSKPQRTRWVGHRAILPGGAGAQSSDWFILVLFTETPPFSASPDVDPVGNFHSDSL